jgi:hypothetical protein
MGKTEIIIYNNDKFILIENNYLTGTFKIENNKYIFNIENKNQKLNINRKLKGKNDVKKIFLNDEETTFIYNKYTYLLDKRFFFY